MKTLLNSLILAMITVAIVAATTCTFAANSLSEIQAKQKSAISKVRHSVVNVKAYNNDTPLEKIGSGITINRLGYIITNAHVVSGFNTIEVGILSKGAVNYFPATLIRVSDVDDLALLQISGVQTERLSPAPLAAPSFLLQTEVGDPLFVIGNPYGYNHTVTRGIISKRERTVTIGGTVYKDMIQTNASINQGNSGGAMINLQGEVIGITTAIFSLDATSNGLGFAIPIDRVQKFIDASIKHVGGTQVAAAAVREMETINLTRPVPHPFLGDCTKCHYIAFKTPVTPQEPIPHPDMGVCTKCHDIVRKKPGALVNVALTANANANASVNEPSNADTLKDYFKEKQRNNYRLPADRMILYMIILLIIIATLIGMYTTMMKRKK
ncbi:MAG: trypsin-like peptidase domain-containing protein [Oligoflexia bacterium]|nr:trypsin-like peptidase domain-containing protein [Oligoflexia bacterium]